MTIPSGDRSSASWVAAFCPISCGCSRVKLRDNTTLQAYKHIDTRGYIHLDDALQAYVYKPPDWYRPTDAVDVLSSVFVGLGGLTGVERPQFDESWAAVERLENGTFQPYEQPLTRQDDW